MFIAVEGIDGSGKSTTIKELEKYLRECGHDVYRTAEPTELPSGKLIREFLKENEKDSPLIHEKLALSFAADRLNHLEKEIFPQHKEGKTVLTDRYMFSSVAYQSVTLDYEWVKSINRYAVMPDLIIYIDVTVEKALERISAFREETDLYETSEFLEQIKSNYERILDEISDSVKVVKLDGHVSMDEIYRDIEIRLGGVIARH